MVENSFIFKYGKHKGKSVAWVDDNDPSYLIWVQENAPNLLKDTPKKVEPKPAEPKKVEFRKEPIKTMVPNMNFWNEGPDERSLAYLKKMESKKEEQNKPDDELGY
jgi:hypothetical protein